MKKDEHLLNVTELKNILKKQTKENLTELLVDCYKLNSSVREFISLKYVGQETMKYIFETYKNKIFDVFFPRNKKAGFKIGDARNLVSEFKKICSDEVLVIDLMLYYVEMGVEFTNDYGDINQSFYSSLENMYGSVVKALNKQKDSSFFSTLSKRIKAVVDDTDGIGWGFQESLKDIYYDINWLEVSNIDVDSNKLEKIKEYISSRLRKRKELPSFKVNMSVTDIIGKIIDADEVFIDKMDKQSRSFSDDEEHGFIAKKTHAEPKIIEFVLWQKYCYEMENDYWHYSEGKCLKCGSDKLYIREVPEKDYAEKIVCKNCCSEFDRG